MVNFTKTRKSHAIRCLPGVKVVFGSDCDVEHFFNVQVPSDVRRGQLEVLVTKLGVVIGFKVAVRRLSKPLCPLIFKARRGRVGSFVHSTAGDLAVNGRGGVVSGRAVAIGKGLVGGAVVAVCEGRHVE